MGLARAEPAVASNSARGDQGDEAAVKWNIRWRGRSATLFHGNVGLLHDVEHVGECVVKRIFYRVVFLSADLQREYQKGSTKNQHADHGSRH